MQFLNQQTLGCNVDAAKLHAGEPKREAVHMKSKTLPAPVLPASQQGLSRARARAQAPPTDSGEKPPECKQQ
jgi:hypothetical protein